MSEEQVDLRAAVEEGMKEEIQEEVPSQEVELSIVPDWSPEEAEEAEAMGWIPPDRSKKLPEGKKFVGPKEFMERNPLYGKLKQLETSMGQLTEHYQKVSEMERSKAEKEFKAEIARLKAEKVEALDNADHARVVEIDEEIQNVKKPEDEAPKSDPVFDNWVKENKWYEEDKFLQIEATKVGELLYSDKLYGKPLLEAVKNHLKEAYPDKFKNTNREKPSAVEGGTNKPSKAKTPSINDLTADERKIFDNFQMSGILKTDAEIEKYVKEAIALRD